MLRRSITQSALVTLSLSAASWVQAHGDKPHAKTAGANPPRDQKDWGIAGDKKSIKRVVKVSMADNMRFSPEKLTVKLGETIRFEVKNNGAVMHEFVIGTKKENLAHAEMMLKHPTMEHDEPYMAHVGPGKTGEIVWHFNRAGEFEFACLIAGHFQAGMKGSITVTA